MKVLQNGKEVKGATVIFDTYGNRELVRVDGVNYDAKAFEFEETKAKKVTKPASKKTVKKAAAKKTAKSQSSVLSTATAKIFRKK